jgi:hypothetical protein
MSTPCWGCGQEHAPGAVGPCWEATEVAREVPSLPQESTPAPEGTPGLIQPQSGPERPTATREHAVPCQACGVRLARGGKILPNTMTYNDSALCDRHEKEQSR